MYNERLLGPVAEPDLIARGRRLREARKRLDLSQDQLAKKLNWKQTRISECERGELPGSLYLDELAQALHVPKEWLAWGTGPAPWSIGLSDGTVEYASGEPTQLVGIVTAGDGDLGDYIEPPPTPMPLPQSWKLIRVEGMSAYPVIYPKQLVFIDTERATSPAEMTADQLVDLHDNIVVCQVQRDGEKVRAYLKRFCHAPGAAGDFILASVDAGRSSPFIPPADIFLITPVVGVLFQDPTKPRVKMHHAKTVIVDTEI